MNGQTGYILSVQIDLSLVRALQSNNHGKDRGFACSVWAEQTDDLALSDIDRHIVYDTPLAIGLLQPFRSEHTRLLKPFYAAIGLRLVGAIGRRLDQRQSFTYPSQLRLFLSLLPMMD